MAVKSTTYYHRQYWVSIPLTLLWSYSALSKALEFKTFQAAMHNQPIPSAINEFLIWLLPLIELLTALLLIFETTRRQAFYLSAFLMFCFTGYVALINFHFFSFVPCSCGGVIKLLGWKSHLVFNLFFLLLSFYGVYISLTEKGGLTK
ncbi:MauE/DoxX family redox-associated membrane protein [Mucilaginibacter gynuensis]|uniref:MauE/DoxX family redox-associated membrane protein n=1 Tax=Mucilaginibacter gynuensis TaxID=1302236 RepID=UPI0031E82AC3